MQICFNLGSDSQILTNFYGVNESSAEFVYKFGKKSVDKPIEIG